MTDRHTIQPYSAEYAEAFAALNQSRRALLRSAPRPGTIVRGNDGELYRVTYIHVMFDGSISLDGNWKSKLELEWTTRSRRVPAPWTIEGAGS